MRPPLFGWVCFVAGVVAGIWGAVLIATLSFQVGRGQLRAMRAENDSIRSALRIGVIIRGPDGRPAWIAPPRDTLMRRIP